MRDVLGARSSDSSVDLRPRRAALHDATVLRKFAANRIRWDSVLSDPRAAGKPWLPIQQRRLSEIPRELLRVECLRCLRTVEIQKADALRLYGPHEEDGCWPSWG